MASKNEVHLLRIEQVAERIQLGRSWIWGAVKRGDFPAPLRLSTRCTRWDDRLVDQWIRDKSSGGHQP